MGWLECAGIDRVDFGGWVGCAAGFAVAQIHMGSRDEGRVVADRGFALAQNTRIRPGSRSVLDTRDRQSAEKSICAVEGS